MTHRNQTRCTLPGVYITWVPLLCSYYLTAQKILWWITQKKERKKTDWEREMETKPTELSSSKMYGGYNKRYKHYSPTLGCSMTFHIYFPPSPSPSPSHKFPVSITPPPQYSVFLKYPFLNSSDYSSFLSRSSCSFVNSIPLGFLLLRLIQSLGEFSIWLWTC